MQGVLFDTTAWQLVVQADWMSKFVLLSLFFASVGCIAIIILKFTYFNRELRSLQKLTAMVREIRSYEEFVSLADKFKGSAGGQLLRLGISELQAQLRRKGTFTKLPEQEIEAFELYLNQISERLTAEGEDYLPVLGTSAAVAPLVGLFGTVWGLIHSFINISQEKSADIAVVAPGIAEALLTTLAGLIVAIPAMIFFHYFSNKLRKIDSDLAYITDRFMSVVYQQYQS